MALACLFLSCHLLILFMTIMPTWQLTNNDKMYKTHYRAGKTAQSVNGLLNNHEDLGWDSQNPCKNAGGCMHLSPCIRTGGYKQISGASWEGSLATWLTLGFVRDPFSRDKIEWVRETSDVNLQPLCASTHTLTCAQTHSTSTCILTI